MKELKGYEEFLNWTKGIQSNRNDGLNDNVQDIKVVAQYIIHSMTDDWDSNKIYKAEDYSVNFEFQLNNEMPSHKIVADNFKKCRDELSIMLIDLIELELAVQKIASPFVDCKIEFDETTNKLTITLTA